jgi:hypothetical protein
MMLYATIILPMSLNEFDKLVLRQILKLPRKLKVENTISNVNSSDFISFIRNKNAQ